MLLAEYLPGTIAGLDLFPEFIEKLNHTVKRLRKQGKRDRRQNGRPSFSG